VKRRCTDAADGSLDVALRALGRYRTARRASRWGDARAEWHVFETAIGEFKHHAAAQEAEAELADKLAEEADRADSTFDQPDQPETL